MPRTVWARFLLQPAPHLRTPISGPWGLTLSGGVGYWMRVEIFPRELFSVGRSRRMLSLTSIDATAEELVIQIDAMVKEDKYAINYHDRLIETFQYPAFAAYYALGGIWFEKETRDRDNFDILNILKGRAWGDFMAT